MSGLAKRSPPSIRSAWQSHALLGVLLLLMLVGILPGVTQTRGASVAAGLAVCGGTALVASWALYHRRPFASALYGISWGLLIVGWVVLGYASQLRPLWFTWGVASAISFVAVLSVVEVRREMIRQGRIAPAPGNRE